MTRSLISCAALCASLLLCPPVFGAYPLATDDIGTVSVNRYEIEAAYHDYRDPEREISRIIALSVRRGITERMDAGMLLAYETSRYPEVESLGIKYRIIENWFAMSVNDALSLREFLLNAVVTRPVGEAAVHFNLGYLAPHEDVSGGMMLCSSAFEIPWKRWEFTGEVLADNDGFELWLAGLRFKFGADTFLGAAFGNPFRPGFGRTVSAGFHTQFGGA